MADTSTLTLSALMKVAKPNAAFKGFVLADDMVLAIDISGEAKTDFSQIDPSAFAVIEMGAKSVDANLDSDEQTKNYLRSGKNTTKTGTQRTFAPKLDRYIGDAAQDFLDSLKYKTGQAAIVNYAYISRLNGKGEVGSVSVSVTTDGNGESGDNAGFELSLKGVGGNPTEYDWITKHPASDS